jgi:diguanylate cyclase (GGDEF)-like protein
MIDVDYFKSFNDHNNHIAGDWALKRIAQLLAGNIRKIDFAFRYGGEEFMLALPETNKEKAIIVAKRLKEMIGNTKFLDKNILPTAHLTISLGIATLDEDVSTAQELITAADNCLYLSKELGRDRICILKENGERTEVT